MKGAKGGRYGLVMLIASALLAVAFSIFGGFGIRMGVAAPSSLAISMPPQTREF